MADELIIFDTTLRDGEQSPGASMTLTEKVRIARGLEKMRVNVIEAGFPIASEGDFNAVKAVAAAIKDSTVCGLARALPQDIERAADAIAAAPRKRIHTFIATSPIHMEFKLKMKAQEVMANAVKAVKLARRLCDDVEFSCEDAGRSDVDFLCRVIEAAINEGATTINIPDTVGYTLPFAFGALVAQLIERIPNSDKAVFSAHCHNDLGLATANSLAALQAGARQVECTVNGLGERAGNTALEEVVMAIRTRSDAMQLRVNIDCAQIVPTSRLVAQITGFPVQPNKAIVGANAFAHEAGIHQDGIIKYRQTYEIMRAEDVGWSTNRLVLGKHSGRNAFNQRLQALGYELTEQELNELFVAFKNLADHKHVIYDADLHSLMGTDTTVAGFVLEKLEVTIRHNQKTQAHVALSKNGQEFASEATGNGPVDAVFAAIKQITATRATLALYSVNAITEGTDALGEVMVRLKENGRIVNGAGSDLDIIKASARAYIHAINLLARAEKPNPQLSV